MKVEMRNMKIVYMLIAVFSSNWAFAQNFEGVITMNTVNEEMEEKASLTWYLKGDKSRMDIKSQAGEHTTEYAVISDEKGIDMVSEGHVTNIPQSVMKTGASAQSLLSEKDGVSMNGYICTRAIYFNGKNQTTYWLTDDLKISFKDIPSILRSNMPSIEANGFPIKMETRGADGKIVFSQEVVSVKAAKVDDSKFARK
ncbi:MAG: hypothetical protein ACJAYA_001056 [Bacteroidia bacterium]|jgi:hypothetical protein